MKVHVGRDEAWPEYDISDEDHERTVEVPDGFDKKYRRVAKQWREVQHVLHEAWENADPLGPVHADPPDGRLTPCCGKRRSDLGDNYRTTAHPANVTCKGGG